MAAEQTAVGDITATMEHGLHVSRGDARSVQGRGAAVDITALVDTVTRCMRE